MSATKPLPKPWVAPEWDASPAHDCPDCGCWVYAAGYCEYCYALADFHLVKAGNAVLYRGFDEAKAEAAWDKAWDDRIVHGAGGVPKRTVVHGVLINNPNPGE